jgi:hypothetical protein
MVRITKEMGAVSLILIFLVATLSLSGPSYPGGGEIVSGVHEFNVNDKTRLPMGQRSIINWDIDGNFDDYTWIAVGADLVDENDNDITPDDIRMPGVSITTSSPYNVQKVGDTYVAVGMEDDPVIVKTYEKVYIVDGKEVVYQYNLMYYGMDITYKTKADVYYKDPLLGLGYAALGDWGYFYEDGSVDISALQSFTFSPWSPVGVYNRTTDANNVTTTYTIDKGWLGILDAEIYYRDIGLVDESIEGSELPDKQDENYGHEVQDVIEVGSALNMYYQDTGQSSKVYNFEDPRALDGIPCAINIETSCSLKAGAQYHVNLVQRWDAIAVRNVKVQYKILVKVVATIEMTKLVVTGSQQGETDEDNTFYKPLIAGWSDFDEWMAGVAEYWNDLFNDPGFILLLIAGVFVLMLIIYLVLKFMR